MTEQNYMTVMAFMQATLDSMASVNRQLDLLNAQMATLIKLTDDGKKK